MNDKDFISLKELNNMRKQKVSLFDEPSSFDKTESFIKDRALPFLKEKGRQFIDNQKESDNKKKGKGFDFPPPFDFEGL